jgi:hypothetical protein
MCWRGSPIYAGKLTVRPDLSLSIAVVIVEIVIVVIEVVIVLIPIVIVVVEFFFLFFLVVVLIIRPAFGLLGSLEIELVPGVQVDLFRIAVLIDDLDDLRVGIDGQHLEDLILFQVFVPLPLNRVVVSTHVTPQTIDREPVSPAAGILGVSPRDRQHGSPQDAVVRARLAVAPLMLC